MEKYTVYMHKCLKNNKVYIGITNNTKRRWRNGGIEYRPPKKDNQNGRSFWNAIQKYGWENFESVVLEYGLTFEQAIEVEKGYIELYDSTNKSRGYNISKGGNGGLVYEEHPKGMLGKPQTEHQKESQREWASKENNNCMKNGQVVWGVTHEHPKGMQGKTHSDEFKKKISELFSGGKHPNAKKIVAKQNGKTIIFECAGDCAEYYKTSRAMVFRILKSNECYTLKPSNTRKESTKHMVGLKLERYSENTEVNNQIAKG